MRAAGTRECAEFPADLDVLTQGLGLGTPRSRESSAVSAIQALSPGLLGVAVLCKGSGLEASKGEVADVLPMQVMPASS